jgi:hypothetical protein
MQLNFKTTVFFQSHVLSTEEILPAILNWCKIGSLTLRKNTDEGVWKWNPEHIIWV